MNKAFQYILFFFLVPHTVSLRAQTLYPVWNISDSDAVCLSCGYKDEKNDLKIPLKYCRCGQFHHGAAAALQNGKWGLIDTRNKTILPFDFDSLYHLHQQYFVAEKHLSNADSAYVFSANGKLIYRGIFGQATVYRSLGRILLQPAPSEKSKKYSQYKVAIMDTNFNELITYYAYEMLQASFVNIDNPERPSHENTYFVLNETRFVDGKEMQIGALYKKTGQKIFDSVLVDRNVIIQYPGSEKQRATVIDSSLIMRIPFASGYKAIKHLCDLPVYAFTKDLKNWGLLDDHFIEIVAPGYRSFHAGHSIHTPGKTEIVGIPVKAQNNAHVFSVEGQLIDSTHTSVQFHLTPDFIACSESAKQPGHNLTILQNVAGKKYIHNHLSQANSAYYDELMLAGKYFIAGQKDRAGKLSFGLVNESGSTLVKFDYDLISYQSSIDDQDYFILYKKGKKVPDIFIAPK